MESKKVALVTGATKGIGKACCYELAERGYRLALQYRSSDEEALELAKELPEAKVYQADLEKSEACEELIKKVKEDFNRVDLLVNNAGAVLNKLFVRTGSEDLSSLMKVNFESVFLLSKGAARLMMRQKKGSIINISSVVAFSGNKGGAAYSASKGAVVSLTRSLALELGSVGIRVNAIAPGYIETAMTEDLPSDVKEGIMSHIPLKRFGKAEEVAKLVGFLASEDASYITGSTLHVNGGLLPQ